LSDSRESRSSSRYSRSIFLEVMSSSRALYFQWKRSIFENGWPLTPFRPISAERDSLPVAETRRSPATHSSATVLGITANSREGKLAERSTALGECFSSLSPTLRLKRRAASKKMPPGNSSSTTSLSIHFQIPSRICGWHTLETASQERSSSAHSHNNPALHALSPGDLWRAMQTPMEPAVSPPFILIGRSPNAARQRHLPIVAYSLAS
jgi:hypothetical protein